VFLDVKDPETPEVERRQEVMIKNEEKNSMTKYCFCQVVYSNQDKKSELGAIARHNAQVISGTT